MNQLGNIAGCLEKLQGQAYLRVKDGFLKDSLLKAAASDKSCTGSLVPLANDLEVTVCCRPEDTIPRVGLRIDQGGAVRCCEFAASRLRPDVIQEISDCLAQLAQRQDESGDAVSADDAGGETFSTLAAANRLRVSSAWLKSVVPCTFYTYEEVEGKKKIKEYFWSRELIRLLLQLRSKKAAPEEIQFIADHCCDGDIAWAREIIGRLKSYSRHENHGNEQPAAKGAEPSRKGQPRSGGGEGERLRKAPR